MFKFDEEDLKNSEEYKKFIKGNVLLIHNYYHDSMGSGYVVFIVISNETLSNPDWDSEISDDKYNITRFFKGNNKIYVSVDYKDIDNKTVFEKLLSDYSSGLLFINKK